MSNRKSKSKNNIQLSTTKMSPEFIVRYVEDEQSTRWYVECTNRLLLGTIDPNNEPQGVRWRFCKNLNEICNFIESRTVLIKQLKKEYLKQKK